LSATANRAALLALALATYGCGGGVKSSADLASRPVDAGETSVPSNRAAVSSPAATPYGGYTPGAVVATPTPAPTAEGVVPTHGSNVVGAWSPSVLPWQDGSQRWDGTYDGNGNRNLVANNVLPIHAALLADGRVMTYGTHAYRLDGVQEFRFDVWQPPTESFAGAESSDRHMVLPTGISTHLFCSAQILVPATGQLVISGGDTWGEGAGESVNSSIGTREINVYDPATNGLSSAGQMAEPRWYATPTTLPDGDLYLQGGTDGRAVYPQASAPVVATRAEIRNSVTGQMRTLTGFDTVDLNNNYPRNWVAPDGSIFGYDHSTLYKIDYRAVAANGGTGVRVDFEDTGIPWNNGWASLSTAVMFRPGRILQIGGVEATHPTAGDGRDTQIIDINGAAPRITNAARISQRRQWANSTVLPDGKVVLMGGSERNILDLLYDWKPGQLGYPVEIYDPESNRWTVGPPQQRMRLYHSIAILLPNGTVLSAGGGWPGPQTNLDAEIYYPPYLFDADGRLARRPLITAAPTVLDPGATLTLATPDAGSIRRVTIVKTGSVTHSFNFEQRFIELGNSDDPDRPIGRNGTELQVKLPANRFETPPGFYLLTVIDAAGVPSESRIFRINPG
jgi:hypothetical protein